MDIVRRSDWLDRPLAHFRDEIDDLFSRFFRDWDRPLARAGEGTWWPAMDISEDDEAVVVKVELPGLSKDDVELSVLDNTLTITGEKSASETDRQRNYYRSERRYGKFTRCVQLPSSVDADAVEATFADGVLTVTLPKTEQAKPKRIEVKAK